VSTEGNVDVECSRLVHTVAFEERQNESGSH
jgi:hypothetical protein